MQPDIENEMPNRSKRTVNNVGVVGFKGKGKATSPPTTPTALTSRSAGAGRALKRETFLDDITPLDFNRRHNNNEEERAQEPTYNRDSHDLSLSPRQITRDSLVDNMLLSLDQFSFGQVGPVHPTDDEMQLYSSFAESDDYENMQYSTPRGARPGHNYSYSSDYDNGEDASRFSSQFSRGRRSNSSSTFQTGMGRINSIRNDPFTGTGSYQIQSPPGNFHSRNHRGSRGSSASSLDLTYTQGSAKRWTNRRSSSFDHGHERDRNFRLPNVTVPTFSPFDYDAAPTPTIPVGPRRIPPSSPMQPPTSPFEIPHKIEHKKSIKAARAPRDPQLETSPRHFRGVSDHDRDLPPLPPHFKDTAPGPLVGYGKSKDSGYGAAPGTTQQTKNRPGFFRRVFGGSSKNTPATGTEPPPSQGSTTSNETSERPRSKPPQHIASQMKSCASTPEASPRPALTKKPSSFFRRRKKSISEPEPTPAVPHLDLSVHQTAAKQSLLPKASASPVSSLRQVMNPYLSSPVKSHSYMHHATLDQEVSKPIELINETFGGVSTIRAVPDSQETGNDSRSTSIPIDHARGEYGGTFLRDSSDNDRDVQNSSPPVMKDSTGKRLITKPGSRSSSTAATGKAIDTQNEKKTLPTSSHVNMSDTPNTSSVLSHSDTDTNGPLVPEKDEEWFVLRKNTAPQEKGSRIVLLPSSSEENLRAAAQKSLDLLPQSTASRATRHSESAVSDDKPTRSIPTVQLEDGHDAAASPVVISPPDALSATGDSGSTANNSILPSEEDRACAQQIYDGKEDYVQQTKAAAWLGEEGPVRHRTLMAYLELYDFSNLNILAALRLLCGRLVLKAESQQVDRILDVFARRWCTCNPNHGFKLADVVHTICYSILLLNTDLYLADIEQKMTRSQFVKNTMPTIRQCIATNAPDAFEMHRPSILPNKSQPFESDATSPAPRSSLDHLPLAQSKSSIELERPSWRSSFKPAKVIGESHQHHAPTALDYEPPSDDCGPLVKAPFYGTLRTWEVQLEIVLKDFYSSIRAERLPLFGAPLEKPQSQQPSQSTLSVFANGMLRRTPSVLSKAPSEIPRDGRARTADGARLGTGKWNAKNRSRPRLYANSAMSSSRTSLDDQSSMWSPSVASSTWTKYSLGKTQTSMSVDSYGSTWPQGDYQQSIGFANALSQAIIREETIGSVGSAASEELRVAPLLEDESLELVGAPWAKEGIVKHKHHLESLEKKAKDRNWNETFAVIEKGYMSLFSFSSKSMRRQAKGKPISGVGSVVGGGNWQENAESLGSFLLRQTIASALPSPGYSKARPHVWALSLPTGAVHLFQVGTPEILREFVSTANYWSARLSNHPLVGGISNIEYGWSDAVVNNALVSVINETSRASNSGRRPSVQSSLRSSIDHGTPVVRARLPGDKIHISDWSPPTQSMRASNLMEQDQLNTLIAYVKGIEEELQKHNQLRSPMLLAFTPRHPNSQKAMANWEKKSSYLLREIVKFRTYIDCLQAAEAQKRRIYAERAAEKAVAETAEDEQVQNINGEGSLKV